MCSGAASLKMLRVNVNASGNMHPVARLTENSTVNLAAAEYFEQPARHAMNMAGRTAPQDKM